MTELGDYKRIVEAPMIQQYDAKIDRQSRIIAALEQQVKDGQTLLAFKEAELANLKHDIERYVAIVAEKDAEIERLTRELFVCDGCGSTESLAVIQQRGQLSCCPERNMLTAREWRSRALAAESSRAAAVEILASSLASFECTQRTDSYPIDHWSQKASRLLNRSAK